MGIKKIIIQIIFTFQILYAIDGDIKRIEMIIIPEIPREIIKGLPCLVKTKIKNPLNENIENAITIQNIFQKYIQFSAKIFNNNKKNVKDNIQPSFYAHLKGNPTHTGPELDIRYKKQINMKSKDSIYTHFDISDFFYDLPDGEYYMVLCFYRRWSRSFVKSKEIQIKLISVNNEIADSLTEIAPLIWKKKERPTLDKTSFTEKFVRQETNITKLISILPEKVLSQLSFYLLINDALNSKSQDIKFNNKLLNIVKKNFPELYYCLNYEKAYLQDYENIKKLEQQILKEFPEVKWRINEIKENRGILTRFMK